MKKSNFVTPPMSCSHKTYSHNSLSHLGKLTQAGLLCTVLLSSGCASLSKKDTVFDRAAASKTEQAYYQQAQEYINKERYDKAETQLEELMVFYPVGKYSKKTLLDLMYVKFKKGEYPAVLIFAENFIKNYPGHPEVDYAWYVKGVATMYSGFDGLIKYTNVEQAHRDVSYLVNAHIDFDNLIKRFPKSKYRSDAVKRMYYIYNQMAEHEIAVAKFNVKRGAYLGAVNRATNVFTGYPQTKQTPEAIAILAHGYEKLGITDKADKYRNLLKLNYPYLLSGDTVLVNETHHKQSAMNRMSLGLFGKPAQSKALEFNEEINVRRNTVSIPDSLVGVGNKDKNSSRLPDIRKMGSNNVGDDLIEVPDTLPLSISLGVE